jgi:hypothetical protein
MPKSHFTFLVVLRGVCLWALTGLIALASGTNSPLADPKIGNWMREHRGDLVIIKGKTGAGSGFVYVGADRKFLVSNIHVMAAVRSPTFTTLDGSRIKLKPGSAMMAVDHDIILMELLSTNAGISRLESFDRGVTVNDPVVVFGNSGGGDVATAINGKVAGVGPNRIEIDAEIERGNSGSPIIHVASGKVIGVATYVFRDELISGKKKDRRFGYRLDTVKQWESVDWARFYSEADKLAPITLVTKELRRAFTEVNELNDRTNKYRVYSYESPAIRTALDVFYSANAKKRISF